MGLTSAEGPCFHQLKKHCFKNEWILKLFFFHKKRQFVAPLKENKTFFVKTFCGFVDSEFVKICHEKVRYTKLSARFMKPRNYFAALHLYLGRNN